VLLFAANLFIEALRRVFKFPRDWKALGKQMAGGYQKENLTGEGENKCSTRLANGGIEARGRMLGCFLGDWEKVQFPTVTAQRELNSNAPELDTGHQADSWGQVVQASFTRGLCS
jgi:hypothetical protein